MRSALILAAALVTSPALAQEMPARKAGLWEMTMTFEGLGAPPQTMQQCIDASTDKAMQDMSQGVRGQGCSKRETKKVGDTIVFDSVCNMGAGTTTSHGVVTGDFNSGLHGQDQLQARGAADQGHAGRNQHDRRGQMARRLQGRPEAGRHDHGERHEDECDRYAEGRRAGRAGEEEVRGGPRDFLTSPRLRGEVDLPQADRVRGTLRLPHR